MLIKKFIYTIAPHIIFNIPIVLFWIYVLKSAQNHEYLWVAWLAFFFGISYSLIMPIILYIHYYYNDKHLKVLFDNKEREFTFFIRGKKKVIPYEQILYLYEVYSAHYFLHYLRPYYYRLITKEKEVIFFSRLRVTRLAKKIDFTVSKEMVGFPIMRKGF